MKTAEPRPLLDHHIRRALRLEFEAQHRDQQGVTFADEIAIEDHASRVDLLLIAGEVLLGVEIKSDRDSLERLPKQAASYSRCLHHATLVTTAKHISAASALVPEWWQLRVASPSDGGAALETVRQGRGNPEVCAHSLSLLIWREDLIRLVRTNNPPKGLHGMAKGDIAAAAAARIPVEELSRHAIRFLKRRLKTRAVLKQTLRASTIQQSETSLRRVKPLRSQPF